MAGPWEVEQKFAVSDVSRLLELLDRHGAVELREEQQVDTYLQHPSRDFRATDEAFRVRHFNTEACVTYKGKRLPGKVKTRPEIELVIQASEVPQWLEMMQLLGFQPLPPVRKLRRVFSLMEPGPNSGGLSISRRSPVTVAIDQVEQLGTFAELELLVHDESHLEEARTRIEALASLLSLTEVQMRSYLSLLLIKLGEGYN